ncbi:MAG TPA: thioredoxin domain-containing protein [Candidatus Acidoferrales bacterium]|nr:thioredoxin domain-containing protein [Candidatus Acidoferrales bacterium]
MTSPLQRLIVASLSCTLLVVAGATIADEPTPVASIQLPGAPGFGADLQSRLRAAWAAQAAGHRAHIEHVNADGSPRYINRLIFSSSPYLQQHALNPVNWYAWGDEAFAAATRENKPIFLSIGYSTCHWCHVMERECFENEVIARLLNQHFIAIKVDREERPDIDNVYVEAVQHMTGGAGWPLTVFLTPDRQPFYGGTYFPPDDRYGQPGLPKLLTTLADAWTTKHEQVLQASADLMRSLQQPTTAAAASLNVDTLRIAYEQMARGFDATNGGFGHAPKFPQAHMLQFLLRYWQRSHEAHALDMVEATLDHMARGGIHDQLGGGFHRYSTDATWTVPHYEKMLYDQAINVRAYLEAYQATGAARDAEVARDVFGYVLRDLAAPEGGFYTAEDADSDGAEGRFYVWSRADVVAAIGNDAGPLIADFYGLTGNEAPAGKSGPLSIPVPAAEFAAQHGMTADAFQTTLRAARQTLLAARARRARPLRDEKIITAWNGLMISSLAYGSTVLGEPQYAVAAARAADFILSHVQRNGRLLRSFRNAPSATPGYLDDYAFLMLGLTDLYAATFDVRWLREADRLGRDMLRLFADPANGSLRYGAGDAEHLIAGSDETDDAALPAAQSVAALVLLRLGRLTMNDAFESRGRALLTSGSPDVAKAPTAHTEMLMALDFALGPTKEIVVAGAPDADGTRALLAAVRRRYLPRSVIALHAPNDGAIEALVPFLKQQTMINDQPTVYVCEHYVCKLPTNDPGKVETLLADAKPAA